MDEMLTSTVGVGKGNGVDGLLGATGLVGAVADTVAKFRLGAVASNVAVGAAKLGHGFANQGVEAVLLQTIASAHCNADRSMEGTYSA